MTFKTILTSKGTTTIPIEIRQRLGLQPGMTVSFVQNDATGEIIIERSHTISELRAMNKRAMQQAGTDKLTSQDIGTLSFEVNANGLT